MRIIAKSTLRDYWLKHADCEQALKSWYQEADKSIWVSPNDGQDWMLVGYASFSPRGFNSNQNVFVDKDSSALIVLGGQSGSGYTSDVYSFYL